MRIFLLIILCTVAVSSEAQLILSTKLGVTMSTLETGNPDNKFKPSLDIGFGGDIKLDDKWDLSIELDNSLYGTMATRDHDPTGEEEKLFVHLYYMNFRTKATYKFSNRFSLGLGPQAGVFYYGKTVIKRGIKREVQGEDDFTTMDYGLLLEGRFNLLPELYVYLNYYHGLNQIFLNDVGEDHNVKNRAFQMGLGVRLHHPAKLKKYFN
jgi:hypothetical protein